MIKKWISVLFGSLGMIGMMYGVALGESYANGQEGLKGSTLPPPGFYYKTMLNLATISTLNGGWEKLWPGCGMWALSGTANGS